MKIINFISEYNNIGNYTPVWGINKMLENYVIEKVIDARKFKKINIEDYNVTIVGGAGLFHRCFEEFWKWLSTKKIPIILWGIGTCVIHENTPYFNLIKDKTSYTNPNIIEKVKKNIVLANVRDFLTNDFYNLKANISFCPTAIYFEDRKHTKLGNNILYVDNKELIYDEERKFILSYCNDCTDNFFDEDYNKVIQKYIDAKIVVTTKLHGAIIANSLGRPYIAYSKDQKIKEFYEVYKGGLYLESLSNLPEKIKQLNDDSVKININYEKIYLFANKVKSYLNN